VKKACEKGKGELYDYIRKNDGFCFLPFDDYDYLHTMSKGIDKK